MEVKVKINYLSGQLHQKFFSQYNKKKIQQYYLTWLLLIFLPLFFFSPEWDVKKQILFVIVPVAAHNIIMHCLCRGRRKYSDHNTNTYCHFTTHHEGWRLKNKEATADCTGKITNNPGSKSPSTLLTSGKVASVNFTSLTKTSNKQYLTTVFTRV